MARRDDTASVRVWDPLVRTGHWVLVVAFATAYLTEGEPEWLHTIAGYAIVLTVAVRVLWGFLGPRHARFSNFVTGPTQVFGYLRDLLSGRAERHLGHSPAGGAMTIALLVALSVTAISGMGTLAAEEGRGPLAGIVAAAPADATPRVYEADDAEYDDDAGGEAGEAWEDIHEVAATLTLVLVFLHVGGVGLASYAHRENLARAMVTGRKPAE